VQRLAGPAAHRIRLYFPAGLSTALGAIDQVTAQELAVACEAERDAWATDTATGGGRGQLRQRLFDFARTLEEHPRRVIVAMASEIGTL
jgi:hypothetical protein